MSAPGFLAVSGTELVNNARTLAYLGRGLGGSGFENISGSPCPDLLLEAWPLATCPNLDSAYDNALYSDPTASWRKTLTVGPATTADVTWRESGTVGFIGASAGGVVLPSVPFVAQTVRLAINTKVASPTVNRGWGVARIINPGPSSGYIAASLNFLGGGWQLGVARRPPTFGTSTTAISGFAPGTVPTNFWWEVAFTATGFSSILYGGDPSSDAAAPVILSATYGYDSSPASNWFSLTNQTEIDGMAGVTEVAITGPGLTMFAETEVVLTDLAVTPGAPCVPTGTLYPSDGLTPADDLYPALYGEFHDPGTDNAPWVDIDRPESYGFLGLLVDSIDGLDATSTRTMDAAADGIGGILGPENLDPRDVTVKGWLLANGCSSMEYARRWLGDTLSGHLCSGCDAAYIDVRTTCGDDPTGDFYTNRWRIYDVGLASIETDTADQSVDCCYVTPVTFKLSAADPYLYGPQITVQAATLLNPDGADSPAIPFDDWLFGSETPVCTTVVDQGIGIDAAIFTFYGGATGIEAGVVYPGLGAYPYDSTWPNDCLFPADGQTLWTDGCPFAFSFSIGAGETFVVDNARRRVSWILSDGTVLDGAPQMILNPGDVIQWIDTCAGASIDACAVAYAACTCDDTATVTIQTQHRER